MSLRLPIEQQLIVVEVLEEEPPAAPFDPDEYLEGLGPDLDEVN